MPSFHFKGKPFLQNYHHTVKFHKLTPVKEKGVTETPSLNDNLIIQGDNLKALKALLPTHAGKVKCIYIDPPYNTGNENWVYNDNVASPMIQAWLGNVVNKDDLTRHDKWCCMMYPRLTLLRELLREDGVIFISIDDNEVHHLRMMMDEIFGEENFRNNIIIRRGAKSVQAQFENIDRLAYGSEYVLVYSKNENFRFNQFRIELEEFKHGSWNNHWRGTDRPTMRYPLFGIMPERGQWRWSKERSMIAIENYSLLLKDCNKNEETITQEEIDEWWEKKHEGYSDFDLLRLSNNRKPEHYIPPSEEKYANSLWSDLKPNGSSQLNTIFDQKIFDTPKSVDLIIRLLKFAGVQKNDIVLDSFAGSGTTAHAVLDLNKEDGGNRKFILVECEDYADTITAERIRRVIKGVPTAKDENLQKGLGGTFSYFELGEELEMEKILEGESLPSYEELASYAFFTSTGENLDIKKMNPQKYYLGSSSTFEVFLLYEANKEKLKNLALNLDFAISIKNDFPTRQKLVFAPACFMEEYHLKEYGIRFAQLPFEIYRIAE